MDTLSPPALSRSQRLKAASHERHERLDARIMRAQPFASREHYRRFLRLQWRFHQQLAPLYARADLAACLPDLAARQRLAALAQDCADLALPLDPGAQADPLDAPLPRASALGWLYVAEGSKLGAAVLFKLAAALGLDAEQGARHLASPGGSRLGEWRAFTAALDALPLSEVEEAQLVAGAQAAFDRVHALAAELL